MNVEDFSINDNGGWVTSGGSTGPKVKGGEECIFASNYTVYRFSKKEIVASEIGAIGNLPYLRTPHHGFET